MARSLSVAETLRSPSAICSALADFALAVSVFGYKEVLSGVRVPVRAVRLVSVASSTGQVGGSSLQGKAVEGITAKTVPARRPARAKTFGEVLVMADVAYIEPLRDGSDKILPCKPVDVLVAETGAKIYDAVPVPHWRTSPKPMRKELSVNSALETFCHRNYSSAHLPSITYTGPKRKGDQDRPL